MWAKDLGGRPWRAPSTTATSAGFALLAVLALALPAAAGGADPVGRVLAAAAAYGDPGEGWSEAEVRRACGADALCAARRLVAAGGARLVPVDHPDTDTIRWARTRASVASARRLDDGRGLITLDGFGRKAGDELLTAVAELRRGGRPLGLVLDLRGNAGGDFGRMLRLAAMFIGDRKNAVYLVDTNGRHALDLEGEPAIQPLSELSVLVGPGTASSAEVLAALLHRYAGAALLGAPTAGKDHLTRVVPVDHDWRLLLPAEGIEVPGVALSGGLVPRPLSPDEQIAWATP